MIIVSALSQSKSSERERAWQLEKNRLKLLTIYEEKYDKIDRKRKRPKYECGQTVRVFKDKGKFKRGYLADFTKEHFMIKNLPIPWYTLSGLDDENIKGSRDNIIGLR